jgi:glutathione S-transferase
MRNTYLVRVSLPTYYELKARSAQEAQHKAEARFQKEHPSGRVPTVEVIMDEGFGMGVWDSVDAAIDEYKERRL